MSLKKINNQDLLTMLIEEAKKNGASTADVIYTRNTGINLNFRNNNDETIERYDNVDIGLRVFVGKKNAIISTNDTSEKKLKEFASKAVEMAKIVPEDNYSLIASKELLLKYPIDYSTDLEVFDKKEPKIDELRKLAQQIEESALNVSKCIKSDGSQASWDLTESQLMTSNGFIASNKKTNNTISIIVIGNKSGKMERDYDFSSKVFFNDLEDPIKLGRNASEDVIKKLGSIKPKTGKFPIIFNPRVARSIATHIASCINGSSISRGTSFLKDSFKKKVFSKYINVVDDPLLKRGLGSRLYDGEGIGVRKTNLVDNGTLKNFLLDISSGIQLNMETNGNAVRGVNSPPRPGTTNLIIMPGQYTQNDLINNINEGFLITELIGSSISLITGDYSRGASGFWIKNGKISHPISEATIAGNLKEMFMQLTPANDLDLSNPIASPSIMLENMVVAGN